MRKFILFFLLSLFTFAASADVIRGKAWVVDGDTLRIKNTVIRLHGINAPEVKNKYGKAAFEMMLARVKGRILTCKPSQPGKSLDKYNRLVAKCYVLGDDVSEWMVRSGMARAYLKYSKDYERQELQAKKLKLGMWAEPK